MPAERLVGLTEDGEAFTFAINNVNLSVAYNSASWRATIAE